MAFQDPQRTRWGNFTSDQAQRARPPTLEAPKSKVHIFHHYDRDDDENHRPSSARVHSAQKYKQEMQGKGDILTWSSVNPSESAETHYRPQRGQSAPYNRTANASSIHVKDGAVSSRNKDAGPENCPYRKRNGKYSKRCYGSKKDMVHWDDTIVDTRPPRQPLPPSPERIPKPALPSGPPRSNMTAPFGNSDNWKVESSIRRQPNTRRWCERAAQTRTSHYEALASQKLNI